MSWDWITGLIVGFVGAAWWGRSKPIPVVWVVVTVAGQVIIGIIFLGILPHLQWLP